MSWIDAKAQVAAARTAGEAQVNTFLTPTSLVTFGGASTAVVVIWRVLGEVYPAWRTEKLVPLVLSFLIGAVIYLLSDDQGTTWRERLGRIAVGIINCFFLAAAALGIGTVAGGNAPPG
jgi:hypothetical protein